MDTHIIITIIVIIIALIFFIARVLTVDVVAIGAMLVLVLTGVITPQEGVEGFANTATITVMAMFVFSASLIKTNAFERLEPYIAKILKKGKVLPIAGLATFIGGISAFVNNTPVVATFIPIIKNSAIRANVSLSKFLIPLSYISIFGGTCTLIGTSTNLLVNGIAIDHGLEPFSIFLMAPLGLVFFAAGLLYLFLFGNKLLPDRKVNEKKSLRNEISNYLTQIKIVNDLSNKKNSIKDVCLKNSTNMLVQIISRDNEEIILPDNDFELKKDDLLLIKANKIEIKNLLKNEAVNIVESLKTNKFSNEKTILIEIILTHKASIVRKRLDSDNFIKKYNANILAIRHRGQKEKIKNFKNFIFKSGDVLLLETNEQGFELILEHQKSRENPFIILGEVPIESLDKKKLAIILATLVMVIILATTNLVPIMISALSGVIVLNISRVITMKDVYNSIDWQVIFLLAGSMSFGKAMFASGLADLIAVFLTETIAGFGPIFMLSALYLFGSLLTGIISNTATAALLAPLAISIAIAMDVSSVPFLMAVAFSGSASFFTPIGYQTNTMVYSVGKYTFLDFIKIGTPLNLIFWLLATLLIPFFYPF